MSWEDVIGRGVGTPMEKIPEDQISLVSSSANGKPRLRLTCHTKMFVEGTRSVLLRVDKEKKRIGLFVLPKDRLSEGKALCTFGKSNKNFVYVTLPKWIEDLGFTKGRYTFKKREEDKDMYFFISLNGKVEKEVKKD